MCRGIPTSISPSLPNSPNTSSTIAPLCLPAYLALPSPPLLMLLTTPPSPSPRTPPPGHLSSLCPGPISLTTPAIDMPHVIGPSTSAPAAGQLHSSPVGFSVFATPLVHESPYPVSPPSVLPRSPPPRVHAMTYDSYLGPPSSHLPQLTPSPSAASPFESLKT